MFFRSFFIIFLFSFSSLVLAGTRIETGSCWDFVVSNNITFGNCKTDSTPEIRSGISYPYYYKSSSNYYYFQSLGTPRVDREPEQTQCEVDGGIYDYDTAVCTMPDDSDTGSGDSGSSDSGSDSGDSGSGSGDTGSGDSGSDSGSGGSGGSDSNFDCGDVIGQQVSFLTYDQPATACLGAGSLLCEADRDSVVSTSDGSGAWFTYYVYTGASCSSATDIGTPPDNPIPDGPDCTIEANSTHPDCAGSGDSGSGDSGSGDSGSGDSGSGGSGSGDSGSGGSGSGDSGSGDSGSGGSGSGDSGSGDSGSGGSGSGGSGSGSGDSGSGGSSSGDGGEGDEDCVGTDCDCVGSDCGSGACNPDERVCPIHIEQQTNQLLNGLTEDGQTSLNSLEEFEQSFNEKYEGLEELQTESEGEFAQKQDELISESTSILKSLQDRFMLLFPERNCEGIAYGFDSQGQTVEMSCDDTQIVRNLLTFIFFGFIVIDFYHMLREKQHLA